MKRLIIEAKLWCPYCGFRHVDENRNGERWDRRAHTTHRCQSCGQDFDVFVSGAPDAVMTVKGKGGYAEGLTFTKEELAGRPRPEPRTEPVYGSRITVDGPVPTSLPGPGEPAK